MLIKKVSLAFFTLTLLVTACKDKEPTPGNTLTARAGDDQNVKVGETITLDGNGSTDSESKPFEFAWTITSKPDGSNATLNSATAGKTTFAPDKTGKYEVQLTVKNSNGESTDKVIVTATMLEPVNLDAKISTKTVLEDRIADPEVPDYIAPQSVTVTAELTLKPGVVIGFARDTRLEINSEGGVLIAKGDSLKKVRFIGIEKTSGFWAGIVFRSESSANQLDYTEVMHTGSKALTGTKKAAIALVGGSKAQLLISNSLFSKNAGYGIYAEQGGGMSGFAKNTFKENAEAGILLDADNVRYLDFNSTFSGGNGRDVVEVSGSSLTGSATSEIVWSGFKDKTPYRMLGDLNVDAAWKIAPGVVIEMSRGAKILVDDPGYINAKGTANAKIVIRGVDNAAASWKGLICFSTSPLNQLEYAEISGGGSVALVSGIKTNVAVYGSQASMEIRNSQINNGGGYGIFVNYQAKINADVEAVNTFTNNVQAKLLQE